MKQYKIRIRLGDSTSDFSEEYVCFEEFVRHHRDLGILANDGVVERLQEQVIGLTNIVVRLLASLEGYQVLPPDEAFSVVTGSLPKEGDILEEGPERPEAV